MNKAGFTKGNVLGFDWEKQVQQSRDSLTIANTQVTEVENQLNNIRPQIDQLKNAKPGDSESSKREFREHAGALSDSLNQSLMKLSFTKKTLRRNIELNDTLMKNIKESK